MEVGRRQGVLATVLDLRGEMLYTSCAVWNHQVTLGTGGWLVEPRREKLLKLSRISFATCNIEH